jgi:hypothetical protein
MASQNNNYTPDPVGFHLNNYLSEASGECFNLCIKDFKKEDFSPEEENCVMGCYAKYFVSFSNMGELLNYNVSTNLNEKLI